MRDDAVRGGHRALSEKKHRPAEDDLEALLAARTSRPVELLRACYYALSGQGLRLLGSSPQNVFRGGDLLGRIRNEIGYVGRDRSKKAYLAMLAAALPAVSPDDRRTILLRFWQNHQKMLLELFLTASHPDLYLRDRVEILGREHLDAALDTGRGAVLAAPHFGNERIIHLALGHAGYPVTVVTSRFRGAHERVVAAKLEPALRWNRLWFPDEDPRELYRTLKRGGLVQCSPTAPGGRKDPVIDFLNHRVKVSAVPARLCLTTGAALLPAFDYRLADNRHRVEIGPPLTGDERGTEDRPCDGLTRKLMRLIETRVLATPEQFYWMWLIIRSQELRS